MPRKARTRILCLPRVLIQIAFNPANSMRSWLSLLVLLCCGGGRTSAGGGAADLRVHRCAPTCGSAGAAHLRLRGGGAAAEPAVTAYEVTGRVDYDRLVRDWGSQVVALSVSRRIVRARLLREAWRRSVPGAAAADAGSKRTGRESTRH